ncbi:MAG: TatD family hydrolase [Pseudomonadota bacterium]
MFTDTHCHIDFEVFEKDRKQILQNCLKKNIQRIIVPSVRAVVWEKTLEVCRAKSDSTPVMLPALGLHPFFLAEHSEKDINLLEEYAKKTPLKAIGEIGLDFYLKDLNKDKQVFYFQQQLVIAHKYSLPVLIHARKSHQDIIQLLKKYRPLTGIIHAFNGSEVQAKEYIELGLKLGFGGAFTYPGAKKLRYLVSHLPLQAMLLETDSPDMLPCFIKKSATTPAPANSPESIIGIFNEFVSLREETSVEIESQLEKNILALFPKNL